jgi:acyl-CoA hydrolase
MTSRPVDTVAIAATDAQLQALAARLRERNYDVAPVDDGVAAREAVLAMIPQGSQVHWGKSKTLEDIGVIEALLTSGAYDVVRSRLSQMDRQSQAREMRQLAAAPDYMMGSVQALTEAGQLVVASASGYQIGPYAAGADQLILVVGSQKLVPDLEAALKRITEHVQPYEDKRLREQMGVGTALCRILILERDFAPGRTTIVLVKEPVGI